ncbi:MAG: RnfABCDGE type electron transport complex subunit D, partial [Pseudomonadota bacterium]|nr:RnfABCDGE type electron transport complex subunit D [Pseudomonadota bacterium]
MPKPSHSGPSSRGPARGPRKQTEVAIRTSPHIHRAPPVDVIMRNVVYALLPVCAFAVYQFGISALALLVVSVAVCVGTENLFCRLSGQSSTTGDWSAV